MPTAKNIIVKTSDLYEVINTLDRRGLKDLGDKLTGVMMHAPPEMSPVALLIQAEVLLRQKADQLRDKDPDASNQARKEANAIKLLIDDIHNGDL